MMPEACAMIRQCAGLSAAKLLRGLQRRRARWAASRRSGSLRQEPLSALPFRDSGLTAFMHGVRREASCSTWRSEEHTSELQSHSDLVCRLLLEKKKKTSVGTATTPPRRT